MVLPPNSAIEATASNTQSHFGQSCRCFKLRRLRASFETRRCARLLRMRVVPDGLKEVTSTCGAPTGRVSKDAQPSSRLTLPPSSRGAAAVREGGLRAGDEFQQCRP